MKKEKKIEIGDTIIIMTYRTKRLLFVLSVILACLSPFLWLFWHYAIHPFLGGVWEYCCEGTLWDIRS
jgi:hypothetical protein